MTGISLRNVLGHAKRLRIALRAAEPLCVLRNVPERNPRHAPGSLTFTALRSAGGKGRGCWGDMSRLLFRALRERRITLAWTENVVVALTCPGRISGAFPPARNYSWHTCAKAYWCYTCNCCFRAGWNSPLAVNRAVPKGCRGAGEASATGPMSPRPVRVLVRMPAELVRSQYQRLESG